DRGDVPVLRRRRGGAVRGSPFRAEVVRNAPSGCRGGWVWDMKGVRRVLYRLPALKGCDTVFVVEGEKDADALATYGLAATTCPWGAGSWRDEYAQQLRDAGVVHVVVQPDNDDAGREFANAVEQSCVRAGRIATVIHLPGLPPKGDVSDWLAAGHGRDETTNAGLSGSGSASKSAISSPPFSP